MGGKATDDSSGKAVLCMNYSSLQGVSFSDVNEVRLKKIGLCLKYILIAEWPDHQRCSMHPSC
jgi:hypothetical protein